MRLLMTSYELPPNGGGGGRFALDLACSLADLGDEVDVVTMAVADGHPPVEGRPGVHIHHLPARRRRVSSCTVAEAGAYVGRALPAVGRLLRSRRYDLIHSHFILPDGLVASLAGRRGRLPYLITAHGSDVPGHNPSRLGLLHAGLRPVWARITSGAAGVVCASEGLRARVERANPRARVSVIPSGFDPARFDPSRPRARRILSVSRLVEAKGLQHLFRALQGFRSDYEVVVVGDGPYAGPLRELAATLGLRVDFRGWLDQNDPELRRLYETSEIFAFPSEGENFPTVLLEAMAAGLAVVAVRDPGSEAVVGDAARLVPARDPASLRRALDEITASPGMLRELGARARRRVERELDWGLVVERYRAVYRELARVA